ncbi:tRNA (adenosine(37)-N6)-dimethylallyltransferase MiaA [uncultured Helicobacter sp.]|uniref:tRNA (adenosine(37)-N6)-dimethylallyltransferase MiaA n=1 Tax=uncultured Helicobacter sp. TaxID=175537 RepID=UPI002635B41E|nr:tRNA (adenosine(37)-N6)-dimethylallyltransferase MiaA [uncultured Helicobacter sp.]
MRIIAILGGSGSGKSALALELASTRHCAILSLDSLSIYQEINIASAKPSLEERKGIPHFGIDVLSPNESQNVYNFVQAYYEAKRFCETNHRHLLIVGGTSFYLKALLYGLSPAPALSPSQKLQIESTLQNLGDLQAKYLYLSKVDSLYANKIKPQDSYRITRALEIYFSTQTAPSVYFANHPPKPILQSCEIFEIVLTRELLKTRIKERTQNMLKSGLIEEVQRLVAHYGIHHQWIKSIGIKETLEYLNHQKQLLSISSQTAPISSLQSLCDSISIHTAQLAKRQRTFNKTQFPSHFCGSATEICSQISL